MGDLTKDLIDRLAPGARGPLELATQSVRQIRGDDGAIRGVYDGARLLAAADSHAYGTPAILDAQRDVKGDGRASFNEIRQVARHFDVDGSLVWDQAESRAFEREVGIRWIPS